MSNQSDIGSPSMFIEYVAGCCFALVVLVVLVMMVYIQIHYPLDQALKAESQFLSNSHGLAWILTACVALQCRHFIPKGKSNGQ